MGTTGETLIAQKLDAFERIRDDFVASFQFAQEIQGQKRFGSLTIADAVRYLRAQWIIECKDRLLSVPRSTRQKEGQDCLRLLATWQDGATASVVAYLHNRLDMEPFASITQQIQDAEMAASPPAQQPVLVERLRHGRLVMLNRSANLLLLFDALFAPGEAELIAQVRAICANEGLGPEAIAGLLAGFGTPLYAYRPHPALARRNMVIMNDLGMSAIVRPDALPASRTWRLNAARTIESAYAEASIADYQELTAPGHNNLLGVRFVDRPDPGALGPGEIVVPAPPPI
jgi:hypothetical protein